MKMPQAMLVVISCFALLSCSPENGQQQTQSSQPGAEKLMPPEVPPPIVTPECKFSLGFDVWEPYQYVDVDGDVRGLDIEVVENVLDIMGCEPVFIQGTWVNLLNGLKEGEVDMLLGASKTDAREEYAYFSEPYRKEIFNLYIRKDDKKHAAMGDIDEFIQNQSKIGIVGDYYYGPRISILLDGAATSKYFVSGIMGELNIARLLDQDIDGFIEDSFVGASMLRRKGLSNYIVPHGFSIDTGDIYVMFSQASVDEKQVERFNEALSEFKSNGEYNQIINKYAQ